MVFSSTVFLFIFLPAVFGLYCLIPERHVRNGLLILASLAFYAYGEPFVVFLMVLSIGINYLLGLMMDGRDVLRKVGLIAAIVWNLGLLGFYKYLGFFVRTIDLLPFADLPVPDIPLPIGISFFTFQAMSYVIDAYRRDIKVQKNPFRLLLYITLFPQLIAGPIVKYKDIEDQLAARPMHLATTAQGIRRFIIGLSKKLLIADTVSVAADYIFGLENDSLICPMAWLGALCYTLQIYFDFSGYSDMAIGLGKMFGFTFRENFNYPYCSASITEFWRRWHISVSTWFKEYLYFPLGGNRKGKVRTIVNKWIVFFFTGLWHGAAATFVVWGLMNGALLMLESCGIVPIKKLEKHPVGRAFSHLYAMAMVLLCFTVFRADGMAQAGHFLRTMFGFGTAGAVQRSISWSLMLAQLTPMLLVTIGCGIVLAMPILPALRKGIEKAGRPAQTAADIAGYITSVGLFVLCLLALSSGTYSPFIYLNF